jgi:hypothetical protein
MWFVCDVVSVGTIDVVADHWGDVHAGKLWFLGKVAAVASLLWEASTQTCMQVDPDSIGRDRVSVLEGVGRLGTGTIRNPVGQ